MPHTAAMVHHGGFSTNLGALAHGVKSIIVPMGWDAHENAQRAVEAGVALRIDQPVCTADLLRRTMQSVLAAGGMSAAVADLQRKLSQRDGPGAAARLLVDLAQTGAPVHRTSTAGTRAR